MRDRTWAWIGTQIAVALVFGVLGAILVVYWSDLLQLLFRNVPVLARVPLWSFCVFAGALIGIGLTVTLLRPITQRAQADLEEARGSLAEADARAQTSRSALDKARDSFTKFKQAKDSQASVA